MAQNLVSKWKLMEKLKQIALRIYNLEIPADPRGGRCK